MSSSTILRRGGLAAALAATASMAFAPAARAADSPVPDRLKRQIGVMEKVLDEVLVDSPNLFVYSHEAARGVYLDGFGVAFTLEASLVTKDSKNDNSWPFGDLKIDEKDGKIVIYTDKSDSANYEVKDLKNWREQRVQRDKQLYDAGKAELVNAILDYGETLSGLGDDEWVAVAAFLKDSDYFMNNRISRLVLKAKMKDLRAYGDKTITRDQMRDRLVEEEY